MVISTKMIFNFSRLQQCLPFTVLKLNLIFYSFFFNFLLSCNSAYRLRYWNHPEASTTYICNVATVPIIVYGIEIQYMQLHTYFIYPRCNSTYCLQYWNGISFKVTSCFIKKYLNVMICAVDCEIEVVWRNDEIHHIAGIYTDWRQIKVIRGCTIFSFLIENEWIFWFTRFFSLSFFEFGYIRFHPILKM